MPHTSIYPSMPPCTPVFSPCNTCSPYVMGFGASVHSICLGVFWGASVHISGISMSVSTFICLSVHNSDPSCSPSLWAASLLDWMHMDVCYATCSYSFLCSVFMLCQASTTMPMTTTPPVTVACSSMSSPLSHYHGPSLMELPVTSGQHDVVLPPLVAPRHSGGVLALLLCCCNNLCCRCLFRPMPWVCCR